MKELTREEVLSSMLQIADVLSHQIWAHHKRIAGEYKSSYDALKDMIKLGEMAQALIDLRHAESNISKHLQ